MFTKDIINDYADKLLIGLTGKENTLLLREFDVINDNMAKINNVKGLENIEPLHFPQDLRVKEIRDGRTSRMIDIEDALKNCDDYIDREVEIIRVVK